MKNNIKLFIFILFCLFVYGCVSTSKKGTTQYLTPAAPLEAKGLAGQQLSSDELVLAHALGITQLAAKDQQESSNMLWRDLQSLPISRLNMLLQKSSSSITTGWLQLAIISKQYANQPNKLIAAIQSWQLEYVGNPANMILPTALVLQQAAQMNSPSQIALLLPLNGTFGKMGQAVRDGFMTAFYANEKELPKTPAIKIYDTSHVTDVRTIYNRAVQEGAQFIIGPLTKDEVNQLNGMNFPVPTVMLNYMTHPASSTNLMQFGLSSEQATEQAAEHARAQNVSRILVITPRGDWGDHIQQVFMNQWQQLGGEIAGAVSIDPKDDLDAKIEAILNVDQSKYRGKVLSELFHEPVKTELRRRQDIDGIFIATDPSLTSQIYPLLRFYYAGNLPVISISTIYSGIENIRENQDLNGIQFDDMPWLFEENSLQEKIIALWPDNYRQNNRLYALGVDAYQLTLLFNRLNLMPNFEVDGVTGDLFLNDQRQIVRQLIWAKFQDGIARRV